jgi:predicted transcriptional regulator of viral defense system
MPSSAGGFLRAAQPKRLLTTNEAAELLGQKPHTLAVWRLEKKGRLPYVKNGDGYVRYQIQDLENRIENNLVKD